MNRHRVKPSCCLIVAMLLCLAQGIEISASSDTKETARQLAAAANDHAISLKDRQEALKKLNDAVQLYLSAGENTEAARTLNRVGRLQVILNLARDAITSHTKALLLLEQTLAVEVEIDNRNGLAEAYAFVNERDHARESNSTALRLARENAYLAGEAQALLILSELQNFDNHQTAAVTAREALEIWKEVGDPRGLARTYAHLGRCYYAQNSLPEALQNYESALSIWRQFNDLPEQAGTLIMLGYIEHRQGEWENSLSLLLQAENLIDERAEPRRMGQIAAGLADSFNENGMPENGVIQYQRALGYYRQTGDPAAINYAIWGLGRSYYFQGNYVEALSHLQQALTNADDGSLVTAACQEYIGRVYLATADYAAALPALQSALNTYERAINPREAAQVRALVGQVYQQQGQLNRARKNYLESLATLRKVSDRVNEAATLFALGKLELKSLNLDAAENYLRQSIEATENLRRAPTGSDLTAAFSASVHERYQAYVSCLMSKHRTNPTQGFDARALETSELGRARSLADLLRASGANLTSGIDPKLAEQEKSLRQNLRVKENARLTMLSGPHNQKEEEALEAELAKLEGEYQKVGEAIRQRYPAYTQITTPVAWNLSQIQEQVVGDDDTVLLEYILGQERSYVWAITRNTIESYELPAMQRIDEVVEKVYGLVMNETAPQNELQTATRELSQMVLSPVRDKLNKRRLIIIADGALHYIPFQILSDVQNGDQPLVASTEVINAPSASILGQLRHESEFRKKPTKVLAAFGDPVFASNYAQKKGTNRDEYVASVQPEEIQPWQHALRDIEMKGDSVDSSNLEELIFAKVELANLRELAGVDTFMALGFDATRKNLARTDLTNYSILHFATHGILDPKRPERSGLFLSMVDRDGKNQNGFVGLQDIYALQTPVDLVVLSACRTGLGKNVRGEGLISLTRGFMYAGASSVVASLWKVDDEATAELMKRFYINMLERGLTPSAALREAQNSIRQEPHWRSPYYWAGFTLQGDYRQVINVKPQRRWTSKSVVYSALAFGGFIAIAFWWYLGRRARRTSAKTQP